MKTKKGLGRKVVNELKYRKITENMFCVICAYLNGDMEWIDAHNYLIPCGICLTEDERLIDY